MAKRPEHRTLFLLKARNVLPAVPLPPQCVKACVDRFVEIFDFCESHIGAVVAEYEARYRDLAKLLYNKARYFL